MQQRLKYNSSSIQAAAKKNEKIQKTNSRNPKGLRRPRSGVQIQYANTKKIFSKIQRALSSLLWRVNTICKILKNLFSKIQRALSSSLWLTKYKIQILSLNPKGLCRPRSGVLPPLRLRGSRSHRRPRQRGIHCRR